MTGYAKTGEGKTVLCTGGAGYIGSHTVLKLLESGYDVEILDNFINANRKVMPRLEKLAGRPVKLHEVDLLDEEKTMAVFAAKKYDAVVHFAGLKAVRMFLFLTRLIVFCFSGIAELRVAFKPDVGAVELIGLDGKQFREMIAW